MLQLYDLARKHNGIVLSTDNFTELMLGFWTLHGDVGDYGMIQNLWKTEVYGLAQFMVNSYDRYDPAKKALQLAVDAVATDGLGVTDSDTDQLLGEKDDSIIHTNSKAGYRYIDDTLIEYLNNKTKPLTTAAKNIIDRYERTHFKRLNPINVEREMIVPE